MGWGSKEQRMKLRIVLGCAVLSWGAGADHALGQSGPQPLAVSNVARYGAAGTDRPAAIGLWQEQASPSSEGGRFIPKKVFVLDSITSPAARFTLTSYNLDGSNAHTVTWPEKAPQASEARTARVATAMTIPVVPIGTSSDQGKIFVTGYVGSGYESTDIVTLCYDYDLQLLWMKTYNYVPPDDVEGFYGYDKPVAIKTNQSSDPQYEASVSYDYVAVVGSSQSLNGGLDYVTLCYHKDDGADLMTPKRYSSDGHHDDVPVDLAIAYDANPQLIAVTGSAPDPAGSNGQQDLYLTTAYEIRSVDPIDAALNGTVAPTWPRAFRGTFPNPAPQWHYLGFRSNPARMKYLKSLFYITGTTRPWAGMEHDPHFIPAPPDMLTVRYDPHVALTTEISNQMNFADGITSCDDEATDLDAIYSHGGIFVAITGSSTSVTTHQTQMATQLYDVNLNKVWFSGARWARTENSGGDDEGVSVRMVEAEREVHGGPDVNSAVNVYVGGMSLGIGTGWDFVTLKYDSIIDNTGNKESPWATIPFYNNVGANGDDVLAQIAVECQPKVNTSGEFRRIFITGASYGGATADDWATQFVIEAFP